MLYNYPIITWSVVLPKWYLLPPHLQAFKMMKIYQANFKVTTKAYTAATISLQI